MANVDKRNGFQPIYSSGRQIRRRIRNVIGATNDTNYIGIGDAYTIQTDGSVIRAVGTTDTVHGIVESIVLQGVDQGPVSYEILPPGIDGQVIGIEDPDTEFECTASAALPTTDYIGAERVTLVDTADDTTLNISKQAVGAPDASGPFRLIQPVDRVNNDPYTQYARVIVRIFNDVQ